MEPLMVLFVRSIIKHTNTVKPLPIITTGDNQRPSRYFTRKVSNGRFFVRLTIYHNTVGRT